MVRHRTIDFSSRQVDNESTQPARPLLWKRSLSTKPPIFSSVGLRRFASARYSSNRSAFGCTSKIARNMAVRHVATTVPFLEACRTARSEFTRRGKSVHILTRERGQLGQDRIIRSTPSNLLPP